jgi:cell division protein FtsX
MRDRIDGAFIGSLAGLTVGVVLSTIAFCFLPVYLKLNPQLVTNLELMNEVFSNFLVYVCTFTGIAMVLGIVVGVVKPKIFN